MGNSRFIISVALAIFASLSQATSARCWEAGAAHSSASVDGKKALIWQVAEQDLPMEALYDRRLANEFGGMGIADDTYLGLQRFWDSEIVGNLFPNVGQLLGKWLTEWLDGWAADTVGLLSAMLRTFFLNPNIAAHAQDSATISQDYDDISLMIRQAATVMYAIALDLLLFLFILAIWRYWTEAAWRGGLSVTGAVARLIFTSGILLAWPCWMSLLPPRSERVLWPRHISWQSHFCRRWELGARRSLVQPSVERFRQSRS